MNPSHSQEGPHIELHLYHHHIFATPTAPDPRIDAVLAILHTLTTGNHKMATDLAGLRAAVERTTGVVASAVALITGFIDRLKNLDDQTPEIQALTAELEADTTALATAVNSAPIAGDQPAGPTPEPTPAPEPTPPDETPQAAS